jgi:gluconate 2-dehydrogenase gamma chain
MEKAELSRRSVLRAVAGTLGISWLGLPWSDIASAAHHARLAASESGVAPASFLTPAERADVEAIGAQIIPSDGTPGAREAGTVFFIDRALATFMSSIAKDFRAGLAEFRSACHARHPDCESFAALSSAQQIEFLTEVERTPFFARVRLLTVLGMFAIPAYGGNRDGVGWKLLGFEDRHTFEPPFGYYDRDYPGFAVEPAKPA